MDRFLLGRSALLVRERSLCSSALQRWSHFSSEASLDASFDDDDDGDGVYVFSAEEEDEEDGEVDAAGDVASLAATISDSTAARLALTLNRLSPGASSPSSPPGSRRAPFAAAAAAPGGATPRSPHELYPGEPSENLLRRLGLSPRPERRPETPDPVPPTPSPRERGPVPRERVPSAAPSAGSQRRLVNASRSAARAVSRRAGKG